MATNGTHLNQIRDISQYANGFEDKALSSTSFMTKKEEMQNHLATEQFPAKYESLLQHLQQERDRLSLLLDVNNAVVSTLDLHELLNAVSKSLRRLTRHQYASLCLYDAESERLRIHALDSPCSKGFLQEGLSVPVKDAPAGLAVTSRQRVFVTRDDVVEQFRSEYARRTLAEGLTSACCLPLISRGRPLGALVVANLHEETFPHEDAELLQHLANQIAIAVENVLAFGQVVDPSTSLRTGSANKLGEAKYYLEHEIRARYNFEEIIGESPALGRVLKQIETVAPTDSTVLIQGETGTGKELIARAIHNLSGRRERTFVKMNCAAIPTGLLESELFGHEKGAFTGAIAQRVGRFELADGGTLFLDEVGDIPLDMQAKLLRVLQEQEFERLGSTKTVRVNVRLIAATNADLAQMVAQKQFRMDLYYRLDIFPIRVPPLRERAEDIPLLVRHFTQKYARHMSRQIKTIPTEAMDALCQYPWPGNLRELKNVIERTVILSPGPDLHMPLSELKRLTGNRTNGAQTLESIEREHILRVLRETNWMVGGRSGAATRLGMQRSTLQSRMKKLGITRPSRADISAHC